MTIAPLSPTDALATLSDADLLASVTDDEITQLLAERTACKRTIRRLSEQLDDARAELADTDAAIARWLAETRRELVNETSTALPTEPLTDEMIIALRREATTAGDHALAVACNTAIYGPRRAASRRVVAKAINDARAMDDERPFVRVVP